MPNSNTDPANSVSNNNFASTSFHSGSKLPIKLIIPVKPHPLWNPLTKSHKRHPLKYPNETYMLLKMSSHPLLLLLHTQFFSFFWYFGQAQVRFMWAVEVAEMLIPRERGWDRHVNLWREWDQLAKVTCSTYLRFSLIWFREKLQ